jgi:hypothetical protein
VATSRALGYLGSRKNIVGSIGGLVGLGLGAVGFGGSWWWVLTVGLYGAGALATPPEKVNLVTSDLQTASAEAGALRADLTTLLGRLQKVSGRLPVGADDLVKQTAELLFAVLGRPDALASTPDHAYAVARAIRADLPTSLESYLQLPRWYVSGRRPGAERSAADELQKQLRLIHADAQRVAEEVYALDAQRMADHTRYLEERAAAGANDLEGPIDAPSGNPGDRTDPS